MDYQFNHQGLSFSPDVPATEKTQTETDAHNKEQEAKELAWLLTGPDKVFLYVKHPMLSRTAQITTWLGSVVSQPFQLGSKVNVGGIAGPYAYKRSVDCIIMNRRYVGWYYESSGSYCRLRLSKRQPKA